MAGEKDINVNEHAREKSDGTYTSVSAHLRSRPVGRRQLSDEEKEKRAKMAAALGAITKENTSNDFFEPVEEFKSLPKPFQMATIATIADVPWAASGPPGTGKTVSAKEIGSGLGLLVETVRAGASTQSDFEGIPAIVVGEDGQEQMKRLHPEWAMNVKDQNALVFLDEINRASLEVQNALLKLTGDDRSVEGLDMGPGIRIAAAFNPDDDGITDFSEALRRRFVFIDWPIDTEAQLEHYATRTYKTFDAGALADRIPGPEELVESTDRWAQIAYGFHKRFANEYVHKQPTDAEDTDLGGMGFPNKASWESAFRMVAVAESMGASDSVKQGLVVAAVGRDAGTAFWGYQKDLDLPDPEALLANPASYVAPDRDDKVHVVSSTVTSAVGREPTPERWAGAVSVMCRMADANPDVGAAALKKLFAMRKENPALAKADLPKDELKKYAKILSDSGIMNY